MRAHRLIQRVGSRVFSSKSTSQHPIDVAPGAQIYGRPVKVGFLSLGCAKNLVDSESMIGLLKNTGYSITGKKEEADVLVINTCAFIQAAKEESIDTIMECVREKQKGKCRAVIVAGCLSQRYPSEVFKEIPEVDAIVGTSDYPNIGEVISGVLAGRRIERVGDPDELKDWKFDRVLTTPGHTAYLKIAEGCNSACSFCAIPSMRGKHRSRPMESILDEARQLCANGVKELIVVSQDTTYYGKDLYDKLMLGELLQKMGDIDGLEWIRVHYAYPSRVNASFVSAMTNVSKVLPYLDMPLQHGSPRLLRLMNRPANVDGYAGLISSLRDRIPLLTLRSTFIAGHPGETDEDFDMLLKFLEKCEFDHVGVFAFSQEEGTKSGSMGDQVPLETREERRRIAMELQKKISDRRNQALIGQKMKILVEGRAVRSLSTNNNNSNNNNSNSNSNSNVKGYIGRCYRQSPGIDGIVKFSSRDQHIPGDLVDAEIVAVSDYDLVAKKF